MQPGAVAEGRTLGDHETIHYGLVPRTNRGIFAINELPDLAERIQVALLNVLEERDIQVRGYQLRLPLDLLKLMGYRRGAYALGYVDDVRDPLDALLGQSDILSLHLPLVAATRGLIGARELARMKPDALLVNFNSVRLVFAPGAAGIDARDAVWNHPDLLPRSEDLDDPAAFIDRVIGGYEAFADEFATILSRQLDA